MDSRYYHLLHGYRCPDKCTRSFSTATIVETLDENGKKHYHCNYCSFKSDDIKTLLVERSEKKANPLKPAGKRSTGKRSIRRRR